MTEPHLSNGYDGGDSAPGVDIWEEGEVRAGALVVMQVARWSESGVLQPEPCTATISRNSPSQARPIRAGEGMMRLSPRLLRDTEPGQLRTARVNDEQL
jgi:hypothetical protein